MKRIFTGLLGLVLLACGSNSTENSNNVPNNDIQTQNQTTKPYKIKTISSVTDSWSELIDFEKELKQYLSKPVVSENGMDLVLSLSEDVEKSVPEEFDEPAILARMKVLKTELLASKQLLIERQYDKLDEKKETLQIVYNTLVNQIETSILKKKDYEQYN